MATATLLFYSSFTIIALVFPVVGISGRTSISSPIPPHPSTEKVEVVVDLVDSENFRFAGRGDGERTFASFERLDSNKFSSDASFERTAKSFIQARVKKYKKSVGVTHAHLDEEIGGDEHHEVLKDSHGNAPRNESRSSSALKRRRRAVIFQDEIANLARTRRKIVNHESEGTFVINQVDRATPQYYDSTTAIDINCQKVEDKMFVFSIETTDAGRQLMMHQLNDKNLRQRLLFHTEAHDAVSVDVFKMKNNELFAFTTVNHQPQVAGSTETINTGSTLYRVNLSNNTFVKTQTIHLPFAKSSAFWTGMGEEANEMFLALAPEKSVINSDKTTYNVMVPLYRWQGGYFDYVSELPANNPQSVQHFAMFSHDYLAVANYQDDTGSTSIYSEVFKYHHKESRFVSFQRVQTYGAKDIRHFTFSNAVDERRQEHFIAIANSCKRDESGKPQFWVQSTIMKFGSTRFLPFKSFYSYGALQFLPVKDGSKFYLALADLHGIRLFQYNGWTFVQTYSKNIARQDQQSSPFSIRLRDVSSASDGKSYFTVATTNQQVENGMYGVSFETRNDHRKLVTSVEAWCNGAKKTISDKDLMALENNLNAAPKITDARVVVFGEMKFVQSVKVGELKSQSLRMGRGRNLDHNKFKQMAGIEKEFMSLVQQMHNVHNELSEHVVWVNKVDPQEINSFVHFSHTVSYENEILEFQHLKVKNTMGSIQVNDHLNNVIFMNKPQTLRNVVTGTVIANDAILTTLNGRQFNEYAIRDASHSSSGKQVFTGTNEFLSGIQVTKEIQVGHSFAGLSFTQPEFLLYQGNQTFPGTTMTLTDSTVENLHTRLLNGVDVFTMYADAVSLSGGVIRADKHFASGVQINNAKVKAIDNVDIDSLYSNAIYTHGPAAVAQTFTEPVYFENMEIGQIAPVNPNINEQFDVNFNFIKREGQRYSLQNMKLTKATNIDNLFVKSQLNNVKVLEDTDKLDLLLRNSQEAQHVQSKVLKSVHFAQDVEATQLVDGIHLAGWSHEQDFVLSENEIRGVLTLPGHVQMDGGLFVGKSFKQSNNDVLHVLENSARTDAETLPGSCTLHFDSLEVKGNSDVRGKVNNVFPGQWVVNSDKSTQLDITAEKVFTGPVHLNKDVGANALFGNVDDESKRENLVKVFPNLLLDGVDQTITQEMAFGGKFRVDQASCPNTILDKVPFENLLFKRGDQTVEVETAFRKSFKALGDVVVLGDVFTATVDGIDITHQLKNTLRTNGDQVGEQTIAAPWQFDQFSVTESAVVTGTLSSSNVESLYGDIIRKDSEIIELDGMNLKFGKGAIMSRVEFNGRVNGIPSSEWGNAWLLSRTDQVVESMVEFAGPVTANEFEAPSVNGVDIAQLSQNILRIDRDEVLGADGSSINFESPVKTESGISIPNGVNVNGIDLANDVLLKNSDNLQTVSGAKTFQNGMTVSGNMMVKEMAGFDISNFANLVNAASARAAEDQPLSSLRVKGNLNLEHEPEVTSTVNDKNWNEMINSLWMKDRDVVLNSPVKFESLKLNQGGSMKGPAKLNDIDLKHFQSNYASKTRDQEWTGQVTLDNVENVETLKSSRLENDGTFNGVDLPTFHKSVLRYTGDQEIVANNLKAENLIVNRLHGDNSGDIQINNVHVKDLMTVSGQNVVTAQKTLKNLKANSLVLSENTVIDGVNLGEWNAGAVTRTGNHQIEGPVEFDALETSENVVVDGLVNNIKFDLDNIVTTDKDQEISNPVIIKQEKSSKLNLKEKPALKALGGVKFKGNVNGNNLQDSLSKMVFKSGGQEVNERDLEPIIIKGGTVFNAPLVLSKIKTQALIQGQNVTAMMDNMNRAHDEVHSKGFLANERYSQLLSMTKRMMTVSENRAVFLDYFVLTQTINVAATYVKVLREVGYPAIAIGFKKSELITTENWWSYSGAVDYYQLQIGNRVQLEGTVTDIAELSHGNNNMFAFAVNNEAGSDRPAQAALEEIKTNNVQNFEINKSPDKLSKTFILKSVDVGTANMRPAISQVIYSDGFKSVQSFMVTSQDKFGMSKLTSCMAATTKISNEVDSSVKVYCMDNASGALEPVQEIHLDSPSLTTATRLASTDSTLLAILTRSRTGQPEGLLEIWSHSSDKSTKTLGKSIQFSKQSCLPVFNVISIDSLTTQDGKTFLAIASGALRRTEYQGSVFVYRYSPETHQFKKIQTIEVSHPTDVKLQWLKPSKEVVMYVLSQSVTNNVQVFKRQGLSGWSLVHQFTSENGKSLQVADFTVDGIYRAQLLVTNPTQTSIYAAEFMGINTVIEEELMESSHLSSSSSSLREFIDFDNL